MNAPFRVIETAFKDRQALKKSYLNDPENGGLMVSTTSAVQVDDVVDLKIWLRREDLYLVIRGVVLWSRSKDRRSKEVGIGFFEHESAKRELLLRHTRVLGRDSRARQNARLAASMKVMYKTPLDYVIDTTKDLSNGGMFVYSVRQPPLNSIILFELCVPGEVKPIELLGRVTWRCPGQGVGVRFMGNNPEARSRLYQLVSAIPMPLQAAAG
jgi:Tfp pilus assembly protein PilZ